MGNEQFMKRTIKTLNEYIDCDDFYEIILYSRKCEEIARVKIDKEDYKKVKDLKWHLNNQSHAATTIKNKKIKLHQLVLGKKDGFEIDHINHDKLDNRKQNLRFATRSQNAMNTKSTGYYWHKRDKKWRPQIGINNRIIYLGYFDKEKDAIKARKEAEKKYFGEYAYQKS